MSTDRYIGVMHAICCWNHQTFSHRQPMGARNTKSLSESVSMVNGSGLWWLHSPDQWPECRPRTAPVIAWWVTVSSCLSGPLWLGIETDIGPVVSAEFCRVLLRFIVAKRSLGTSFYLSPNRSAVMNNSCNFIKKYLWSMITLWWSWLLGLLVRENILLFKDVLLEPMHILQVDRIWFVRGK